MDQHVLELPSQAVGGVLRCHRLDRLADRRVAEALLRTRRRGADDRHGGQGRRICVDHGRAPLPRLPVQEDTGRNVVHRVDHDRVALEQTVGGTGPLGTVRLELELGVDGARGGVHGVDLAPAQGVERREHLAVQVR